MTIEITDAAPEWFDSRRYRPRLATGEWFLLADRFRPAVTVPTDDPPEPRAGRPALHRAFAATYDAWELPRPPAIERALGELTQPGAAVIVAGQQPGFLGGPLISLYKALTAIATARRYRELTGRTCVPVFWVAGDDHDLDEVRTVRFPGSGGDAETEYTFPGAADRRPIAAYGPTRESQAAVEAALGELATRRFGALARDLLAAYRERDLAAAFAAALAGLLGEQGLLVIDPVRLRPLAVDVFEKVIAAPEGALAAVEQGHADVRESGIEPQVAARLPLFLVEDGKRQHLSPAPDGLQIDGGGPVFSRAELLERLAQDPTQFSPGALLRPLVQQRALPCVLTIGGPAEVAYFAQLPALARALDVDAPRIALRLGATLFDGKTARAAAGIDAAALASAETPEDLVLRGIGEPAGVEDVEQLAQRAQETLARAVEELPQGTPDARKLHGRVEAIPADIRRFGERLGRAWARTRKEDLARAERLFARVFPGGTLQERRWGWIPFVARHGTEWIDETLAALAEEPLAVRHWWVRFS